MRVGLFGGTFNPPHNGHMLGIELARRQLGLDEVWLIPSGSPPHKTVPEGSPNEEQRFEMTRIASEKIQDSKVIDIELGKNAPCYSWETIRELKEIYPNHEFYFLMGGDMFLYLRHWVNFEYIIQNVKIAVFARTSGETDEIDRFKDGLEKEFGSVVYTVENTSPIEISSTEIRKNIYSGNRIDNVDPAVIDYMKDNDLYEFHRYDFESMERFSEKSVSAKRHKHVLGVRDEAVRLARRWGCDEDDARCAGLLHDITKELSLEEHLRICREHDIVLDDFEKTAPKLLHSKSGAAIAREKFGVSDRIYNAIFWHTTGIDNMSLLDKVLYMADYIEPNRDFDGVEEIRKMAYEDLDEAIIMGLLATEEEVREKGQDLHENSVKAREWFLCERNNVK